MDVLKVAAIAALGLGSTWAAGQVTARWVEPPSLGIVAALAEDGAATGTPASTPESTAPAPDEPAATEPDPRDAGKGKPTASIEEVSDAEVEEAIREAEKALSGKNPPDKTPGEFRSTKPLPADQSISLPSDI